MDSRLVGGTVPQGEGEEGGGVTGPHNSIASVLKLYRRWSVSSSLHSFRVSTSVGVSKTMVNVLRATSRVSGECACGARTPCSFLGP